jgi:hypothetical protein
LRALNPKRFSFRVFATPILSLRSDRRPLQTAPSPICKPARIGIVTSFVGATFGARPLKSRVASLAEFGFEPAPCALDRTTANKERELRGVASRIGCEIVKNGISGAKGRDKRHASDPFTIAAPMPFEAPVTIATLPVNS